MSNCTSVPWFTVGKQEQTLKSPQQLKGIYGLFLAEFGTGK
jgi:hypothetical protein